VRQLIDRSINKARAIALGPWLFLLMHPSIIVRGVIAGPFAGTRLSLRTTWNKSVYLFLGCYEKELHSIWSLLQARMHPGCDVWVLGAADGYYVCGLSNLLNAKITAWESSELSRRVVQRNITLNNLESRVTLLGHCAPDEFLGRLTTNPPDLIVSDIEGGEDVLFLTAMPSAFKKTVLIIELHPPYGARQLEEILGCSHSVTIVHPKTRTVRDYPVTDLIPNAARLTWMQELRPFDTPWLVAIPKAV
jgi:hypothetical protein